MVSATNLVEGTISKTAVKVILQAKETKSIQFVLAWYDNADQNVVTI